MNQQLSSPVPRNKLPELPESAFCWSPLPQAASEKAASRCKISLPRPSQLENLPRRSQLDAADGAAGFSSPLSRPAFKSIRPSAFNQKKVAAAS